MSAAVSRRSVLLAAGAGAVGLVGGTVVSASRSAGDGGRNDADVGFCTDMSAHHLQAMAMCQRVLGRDTGGPVQAAAAEVLQTQSVEVGMMRAWLADWGVSTTTPVTVMAWMGMNAGTGVPLDQMPGFASDDDLRELSLSEGADQGRRWLELMRAHHVGGVSMANAAIELVGLEKVRRLARTQVEVQTYEIEQYDVLLSTDGA